MYLTKRQRELLTFLEDFIEQNRYSPSLEEIAKGTGLSSLATVHVHLRNLVAKGVIRRNWNQSRSIELVDQQQNLSNWVSLPLLGRVAAGGFSRVPLTEELVPVSDAMLETVSELTSSRQPFSR